MAAAANGKQLDVETVVRKFIQLGLKPDEELMNAGVAIAQKIFKKIEEDRFKIARTIFGGSVGKSTDISTKFDFDLVVLLNYERPAFKQILDEFHIIFKNAPKSELNIQSIKQTAHSLQLTVDGLKFDLVPGTNFVTGTTPVASQHQLAMKEIEKFKFNGVNLVEFNAEMAAYSSSLVEAQVGFMRRQSTFVHELVRLAKFWNSTLYIDEYISGRSTAIELIATFAGITEIQTQEMRNQKPSLLGGFTRFLTLVKNFNNIIVTFEGQQTARPMGAPIILEPSNPYNNLAESWSREIRLRMMTYAEETLSRWTKYVTFSHSKTTALTYFPLEIIFSAQSAALKPTWSVKRCAAYLMTGRKERQLTMTVRKDSIEKHTNAIKALVDTYVVTAVLAFVNSDNPNMRVEHIHPLTMDNIKRSICAGTGGVVSFLDPLNTCTTAAEYELEFVLPFKVNTSAKQYWVTLVLGFDFHY